MSARNAMVRLVIAGLLFACAGEDTGTAEPQGAATDGRIGTSDPAALVTELNDAEWKAACIEISDALSERELSHGPCILSALLAKAIGTGCMATYRECVEGSSTEIKCDAKPAGCTATLQELDACIVSSLMWLAESTRGVDCSSSVDVLARLDGSHVTPACQLVQQKCPEFMSSGMLMRP